MKDVELNGMMEKNMMATWHLLVKILEHSDIISHPFCLDGQKVFRYICMVSLALADPILKALIVSNR